MSAALSLFPIEHGLAVQAEGVDVWGFAGELALAGGTAWVLVTEASEVEVGPDRYRLRAGAWAVAPGGVRVSGGRGLIIHQPDYIGVAQWGGPIEATGRLRYIDGCTDTLLVCPPRLGEPCLNHLHLPRGTDQTTHTHPSARVGVIARGEGWCRTPGGRQRLTAGLGWFIPTGLAHSFATDDATLDVLAWHPDSDFGPTDQDHPMVNRTIL